LYRRRLNRRVVGYAPDPVATGAKVGGIPVASSNAIGTITTLLTAWRVTINSTGGSVTVSALQSGIGDVSRERRQIEEGRYVVSPFSKRRMMS
jgi:hypothetical protein